MPTRRNATGYACLLPALRYTTQAAPNTALPCWQLGRRPIELLGDVPEKRRLAQLLHPGDSHLPLTSV